ncbi:MAG: hypothetical protein EDM72_14895 [Chlorobiota bacterium]|nr:MAG: hypothetical protein EDM72_14895 [Chlorobiota bacterium]
MTSQIQKLSAHQWVLFFTLIFLKKNVFTYKSDRQKILILSSESHGPSKEFEKISDKKICIPKIGDAESLNVASASAVLLAQLTK